MKTKRIYVVIAIEPYDGYVLECVAVTKNQEQVAETLKDKYGEDGVGIFECEIDKILM